MKILGWMHRKFRQNSVETHKDFPTGLSGHQTLEDLQCFPKGSSNFTKNNNMPFSKSLRERSYMRNSFAGLEYGRAEFEEGQLFHGFLAIGTLGMEPIAANEPATPNFQILDHIAEKETEATENELKLINDELEKVLGGAEEGKEEYRVSLSSARNSHVSVITLKDQNKVLESGEEIPQCNGSAVVCPLQSYLLGSAAGISEMPRSPTKKERRTSLEELFQKTKQSDESYRGIKAKKKRDKEIADKSSVHLMMKKMLKRGNVKKNSSGEYSAMAEKKLRKIRQMFSRKVHPEIVEQNGHELQPTMTEVKNDGSHVADYDDDDGGLRPSSEDDIIIYPDESGPISDSYRPPQIMNSAVGETVYGGNECWVKSDADYLVLEL